jgi:hypothetical protein
MFAALKRRMRRFAAAPSGTRFRAHYERVKKAHPSALRTMLAIGVGMILLAAGLAMLVLPGPGILVGTIGAALLAGESLFMARLLDRIDLWLTGLWHRWRRR